jgi:hypothetical protein
MNGLIVELDEKGAEAKTLRAGPTQGWATVEVQRDGTYLVPQQTAGKVVELDAAGKVVRERAAANPNAATRLPNGNVLYCSNQDKAVRELDAAGKVVWELNVEGRPFRVRRR